MTYKPTPPVAEKRKAVDEAEASGDRKQIYAARAARNRAVDSEFERALRTKQLQWFAGDRTDSSESSKPQVSELTACGGSI